MIIVFNDEELNFSQSLSQPQKEELTSSISMDSVPWGDAIKMEGISPYILKALKKCPLSNSKKNVFVDIRIQDLKKGDLPHKPGWHCDTTINPQSKYSNDVHHIFVSGHACLTPFIDEPVELDYNEDLLPTDAIKDLQNQIELNYPHLKTKNIPSCTWVTYGPKDFHRVKEADYDEIRLLIRVRETDLDNNISGFKVHKPSQIDKAINIIEKGKKAQMSTKKESSLLVYNLTEEAFRDDSNEVLGYLKLLKENLILKSPPYGMPWYRELFHELALDEIWYSSTLLNNAIKECEGAIKAHKLANQLNENTLKYRTLLLKHAAEEAKHADFFVRLKELLFSNVPVSDSFFQSITSYIHKTKRTISSTTEEEVLDDIGFLDKIIQINIGEFRTKLILLLNKPVLMHLSNDESGHEVERLANKLIEDENSHISYSAKIIESFINNGMSKQVNDLLALRLNDLNEETLKEVGGSAEGYKIKRVNKTIIQLEDDIKTL